MVIKPFSCLYQFNNETTYLEMYPLDSTVFKIFYTMLYYLLYKHMAKFQNIMYNIALYLLQKDILQKFKILCTDVPIPIYIYNKAHEYTT